MENNKLDPEFKAKWVAALRSGKYKQTTGILKAFNSVTNEYSYCCLGVAACVLGYETLDNKVLTGPQFPEAIRGSAHGNDNVYILTHMNDGQRKSFSEIADYIEQNL